MRGGCAERVAASFSFRVQLSFLEPSCAMETTMLLLLVVAACTLGDVRGVGRAQLPSTVIGCLVHGAEHAMRHVGQLSVTARIVRSGKPNA